MSFQVTARDPSYCILPSGMLVRFDAVALVSGDPDQSNKHRPWLLNGRKSPYAAIIDGEPVGLDEHDGPFLLRGLIANLNMRVAELRGND